MLRIVLIALLWLWGAGCASAPTPGPGESGVYGQVRLVPREGAGGSAAGAYGDRRLRDVALVDYTRTGYAVVYATGRPTGGRAELAVVQGAVGARLEPPHAAVGAGGELALRNDTSAAHIVSIPEAGRVERLEPGAVLRIPAETSGSLRVFLLDAPGVEAQVFVAPGPHAVTSESGRYELLGLAPGRAAVRVWHPRFPPAEREVELAEGAARRLDFELSAGDSTAGNADAAR